MIKRLRAAWWAFWYVDRLTMLRHEIETAADKGEEAHERAARMIRQGIKPRHYQGATHHESVCEHWRRRYFSELGAH